MSRKDREQIEKRELDPTIDLDPTALPKPWTIRQYFFALAYLADPARNATKATIAAGFSKKGADVTGHKLLRHASYKHVQQYIGHREQKIVNKYAYNYEKLVEEIVKQATFNIFDFYKPDPVTGEMKIDWRTVPRELGTLIDKIETKSLNMKIVDDGQEIALPVMSTYVEFASHSKGRDMLNRMMKNYHATVDLNINGAIPVIIKDDI